MKKSVLVLTIIFISFFANAQNKKDSTQNKQNSIPLLPPGQFPRLTHTYKYDLDELSVNVLWMLCFGNQQQKDNLKLGAVTFAQSTFNKQTEQQVNDFYVQDSIAYYHPKQKK